MGIAVNSRHLALGLVLVTSCTAAAATPNSLILNEANAVSGSNYLGGARVDPTLGRIQGNGQNWMEFLVVNGNTPASNTLDLRGWTFEWSYLKSDEENNFGSGTMTFSQDPLWAAVPRGTMLTISEWKEAYYLTNTPPHDPVTNPDGDILGAGGMARQGGINGLGNPRNNPYDPAIHTLRNFNSNTTWNPLAQGAPDWNIHVWAGERDDQDAFRYFNFSGTVTKPDGDDPDSDPDVYTVGVDDAAGLFTANNDAWQITIKDAQGNVIQGPIGESVPGWTASGVNSQENIKLEAFEASENPTLATYQNATIARYVDGSSSTFQQINKWNNGANQQDISVLRDWFDAIGPGDVNFDGVVDIFDVNQVSDNWGAGHGSLGGDANGDGNTDIFDVNLISDHWSTGGAAVVPEPSGILLLLVASAAAFVGVRKSGR